jgi:predicted DNA-binding transcriptional regulator YafY
VFVPVDTPSDFLRLIEAQRVQAVLLGSDHIWFPDVGIEVADLDMPVRVNEDALVGVVKGVASKSALRFDYISRTTTSTRMVSPTQLVSYASKYYLRGYDHGDATFKLFMISRMFRVRLVPDAFITQRDTKWTKAPLVLIVNPSLPDHVRLRLEEEWMTEDGRLKIDARKCLHGLIVKDKTQEKKVDMGTRFEYMPYWLVGD